MSAPISLNPYGSNPSNNRHDCLGKRSVAEVTNKEPSSNEFGANDVRRRVGEKEVSMLGEKEVSMLSPQKSNPSLHNRVLMEPWAEKGKKKVTTDPLILLAGVAECDKKEEGKDREGQEGVIGKSNSYTCTFCKKTFRSKQALGGHRASHKGVKGCRAFEKKEGECSTNEKGDVVKREYRCSVCGRILLNAQGLGAHMRIHPTDEGGHDQVVAPLPLTPPPPPSPPRGEYGFDLNMAPPEVNDKRNGNLP